MDYEQKYKHALDLAKQVHNTTISKQQKENIEIIFPELKESWDEMIRKNIISLVNAHGQGRFKESMLAWLEKQGTPNQVSIWKHWKDGIAGNGEGKQIYLTKSGDSYILSSCLCFECDYIELSELDKLLSEKQDEKPAVWSEEDERAFHHVLSVLEEYGEEHPSNSKFVCNWLKSIKARMEGNKV